MVAFSFVRYPTSYVRPNARYKQTHILTHSYRQREVASRLGAPIMVIGTDCLYYDASLCITSSCRLDLQLDAYVLPWT